jgi:hypothetical protein
MSRMEERHHTAGELDHMAELERAWVAEEDERGAVVTACVDAYFECETNEIPLGKLRTHSIMLEFVRIFLFDHRGDVVPKGRNRWEYLIEVWKTSDGEYSLEDCLGVAAKLATLDTEEASKIN